MNVQDSFDKLNNMYYPFENKTSDISHLLQRGGVFQKEEHKKLEDKKEKMSKEKIINIKGNKVKIIGESNKIKNILLCDKSKILLIIKKK